MPASIVLLEQQLDRCLSRPRVTADDAGALPGAAARWAAAVWAAASAAGPVELGRDEVARGFDVAQRPVFICGAHRSGTTLVRDMLDNHPALSVVPAEGTFFTNLESHLLRQPQTRRLQFLGCEWLCRLANPIHQEPYWLLGSSAVDWSPYVEFARALMAWWPLAEQRMSHIASSWPLVAVALAYAHCTNGLRANSVLQRWVEKTPTNERFLDRLRSEFPAAKLIHVVRHPFAVYASHKYEQQQLGRMFRNARRVLRDLGLSYRVALEQSCNHRSDHYLVIRYEDLLESTHTMVERLAAFLNIEPLPVLMQPTAAGLPAPSNSSFTTESVPGCLNSAHHRWTTTLTRFDRERLTAVVGDPATSLGYDLPALALWRTRLFRLAARISQKVP
jgi:sulfotransferase family protein